MLELHQFRHSAFCLKVRMVLQAKGLSYRVVEVMPGLGQVALFRLSGQRQVPVLVDDNTVVADSSAIARHLEHVARDPQLLPADPQQAAQVHLIEDWADTTFAAAGRSALVQAAALDPELRMALLPDEVPDPLRSAMGAIPGGWVNTVTELVQQGERADLLASLEQLARSVESSPWLVGTAMSMADLAVAAQLSLLRFPPSSGTPLAGKGVPGLSDHPKLQSLFHWRDQLELKLMERSLEEV
ncbi:MAG: glutathione S-transferase [Cyanobium sp. NAT70]|nr:glutathione S-transferase [Cyanobium sp. NAT70]|tara:strand:+ start:8064 stop:8789 length:726 start_codon:yes stop_codon:yes gene_type:complete